jgi:hypothetical protein
LAETIENYLFLAQHHKSFNTTAATHATINETPGALKDISKICQDYSTPNLPTYYNYYNESEFSLENYETSYPEIGKSQFEEEACLSHQEDGEEKSLPQGEISANYASFFDCDGPSLIGMEGELTEEFSKMGKRQELALSL